MGTPVLEKDNVAPIMQFDKKRYEYLSKYAVIMPPPSRPILGRDREIKRLLASLNRPELSNAFLLGDAGSGKTALVQGAAVTDKNRIYVEVDLARMAASNNGEDGATQMASRIKGLFEDAITFRKAMLDEFEKKQRTDSLELVLFIDEFHLLIQLSSAAAQAIKPILAESGRRGIKIIAATTFAEFHEYVEKDQALMQRLQRINIREPNKATVISILKSVAKSHNVLNEIYDDQLFDLIYDYTNRYVPADSQPRKSILMLDSMIGWHKTGSTPLEYKLDRQLLGDVIYDSAGVRVSFKVNGREIEKALNNRVFSQRFAMKSIEQRLQIAVADLHDKSRPISSFLFTGPTGVGKTETVKALANLLFGNDRAMIRFDMSEYALETSIERFREELTMRVWNNSHAVILFDEVEKAHSSITRLLLQVLDDARLTNAQGREVSFLNTYIILTTNAGTEIYENIAHYAVEDDENVNGLLKYQKIIRKALIDSESFAPEIINRMNAIIPFQPLTPATYEKIVLNKLMALSNEVHRVHGVSIIIEPTVVEYLVYEKFDRDTDSGGARGLVSRLDDEVISPLSRYINTHPQAKHIAVKVKGDLVYKKKESLESKAEIIIGTINPNRLRRRK